VEEKIKGADTTALNLSMSIMKTLIQIILATERIQQFFFVEKQVIKNNVYYLQASNNSNENYLLTQWSTNFK